MIAWHVHTSTLFYRLLAALPDIDLFLDVGSCDGRESFVFESIFPHVPCIAFEPNPPNIETIQAEIARRHSRVTLEPVAAGNTPGTTTFYVKTPLLATGSYGTSSTLKPREQADYTSSTIDVPLRRLDGIDALSRANKIALWIDVEGAGYFVLEGMAGMADKVQLVHIEVETKPWFEGEKLAPDIMRLMDSYGFALIGSNLDRHLQRPQGDLVFLRTTTLATPVIRQALRRAWIIERLSLPQLAYRILPPKLFRVARERLLQSATYRQRGAEQRTVSTRGRRDQVTFKSP